MSLGRRAFAAACASLLALLLAGCWDRRELNELGISMAMGIDRAGDQYEVTVQVVQPGEVTQKDGQSGRAPVTVYKASGATLFEALRRMTTDSPRKIYSSHLRFVIFGEEAARQGIGDALDLLSRDNELRTDFYLLVAKGTTAENVLDILTPMEKIPANKVYRSIDMSERNGGFTAAVSLDEFISVYESDGQEPTVGGVEAAGSAEAGRFKENVKTIRPAARLLSAGLAAFRKDKLVGWLNEAESKGYNIVVGNVKNPVDHVACPDGGNVALEWVDSTSKLGGSVRNGIPRLSVDVRVEENIGEVQCALDLSRSSVIRDLERRAGKRVEELVLQAVETMQKTYGSDVFGFGEAIRRSDPRAWRMLKKGWEESFKNARVDVKATVKIRRSGTIVDSMQRKKGD